MDTPGGCPIVSLALTEGRCARAGCKPVLRGILMWSSRKRSPVFCWVGAVCFLAPPLHRRTQGAVFGERGVRFSWGALGRKTTLASSTSPASFCVFGAARLPRSWGKISIHPPGAFVKGFPKRSSHAHQKQAKPRFCSGVPILDCTLKEFLHKWTILSLYMHVFAIERLLSNASVCT